MVGQNAIYLEVFDADSHFADLLSFIATLGGARSPVDTVDNGSVVEGPFGTRL